MRSRNDVEMRYGASRDACKAKPTANLNQLVAGVQCDAYSSMSGISTIFQYMVFARQMKGFMPMFEAAGVIELMSAVCCRF